jgi:hypothetical protein
MGGGAVSLDDEGLTCAVNTGKPHMETGENSGSISGFHNTPNGEKAEITMKTTMTITAKSEWSWDDRVAPTCPACGGDPSDPFSECLECEEIMQRLNSRNRKPFGPISPLAERLAESLKDDMYL